ncbi:MAG: hypothetical protein AB1393_05325 [Candidatus Edwardsbacteria bacterium]
MSEIIAISTEIGRGHPNYLDNFLQQIDDKRKISYISVFEKCQGASFFAWKTVASLYIIGSKGGLVTRIYNLIRFFSKDTSKKSPFLCLLGRDLKRTLRNFDGICVVEHPLMAKALCDVCSVFYLHGEIAAPAECVIKGAKKIFVPLEETKKKLVSFGADPNSIVVTGLMIEPPLVDSAEKYFEERTARINSNWPLTVGFFTSGAYPKEHISKILAGAKSVIKHGMKAILFLGTNLKVYQKVKEALLPPRSSFTNLSVEPRRKALGRRPLGVAQMGETDGQEGEMEEFPGETNWDISLVRGETRQEATLKEIKFLPRLDVFVAASHERTNWAVGLGLPMFVLFPHIGTYAPLNFEFAEKQGVVFALKTSKDAENLGRIIRELRINGTLAEMTRRGFGGFKIDGFETAGETFRQKLRML